MCKPRPPLPVPGNSRFRIVQFFSAMALSEARSVVLLLDVVDVCSCEEFHSQKTREITRAISSQRSHQSPEGPLISWTVCDPCHAAGAGQQRHRHQPQPPRPTNLSRRIATVGPELAGFAQSSYTSYCPPIL